MDNKIVRQKIFNIISETFQMLEQENQSNEKIISILNQIAEGNFPKDKIKFFDSDEMDFEEMMKQNNYSIQGEAEQTEYPVVEIKTEDGDTLQFPIQIKKHYSYKFFSDSSLEETNADVYLDSVKLATQEIEVNDQNNNVYKINLKDSLGENTIKKLELQLKKLLN